MTKLKVQKFLIDNSIEDLKEKYNISISEYDSLMSLNYSQIESPKNDPIANECRGLILEKKYPYNVVCRSFDRFYNYGENNIFPDNYKNYITWEKRDGTLINVYNYNNVWYAATRKLIYAEGINSQGYNFNDLFFSCFDKSLLTYVNSDLILIFELTSPHNRIITNYEKTEYRLLAIRNKFTGIEANYDQLKSFSKNNNFPLPNEFHFNTYDDVIGSYDTLKNLEEGYVFINYETMHRFKMKNPSYLAAANIRCNGSISTKNIINLIFLKDHEEYLSMFKIDRVHFEPYIKAYNKMIDDIINKYNKYKHIKDRKEFAALATKTNISGILFSLKNGKTITESFSTLTTNYKIKLITKYL